MAGSRYYEFPFIPRSYGDFVIEPVRYSYYDVNQGKYVTLETQPLNVTVLRGNETESGGVIVAGPTQKDVRNLGNDIRFINVKDSSLVRKGEFFVGSAVFWALLAALMAAAAMAVFEFFIQKKGKAALENFSLAASMLVAMAGAVLIGLF